MATTARDKIDRFVGRFFLLVCAILPLVFYVAPLIALGLYGAITGETDKAAGFAFLGFIVILWMLVGLAVTGLVKVILVGVYTLLEKRSKA